MVRDRAAPPARRPWTLTPPPRSREHRGAVATGKARGRAHTRVQTRRPYLGLQGGLQALVSDLWGQRLLLALPLAVTPSQSCSSSASSAKGAGDSVSDRAGGLPLAALAGRHRLAAGGPVGRWA